MNKRTYKIIIILFLLGIEVFSQQKIRREKLEDLQTELEGKLTLRFFDAITGRPIVDANVEIGDIVSEVTDFEGKIIFEIPEDGKYLINLTHPKYVNSILKLEVIVGTIFNNRFSVSPSMPIGYLRVVLDWGNSPGDLDAHLVKSNDYHISYRNMKINRDNTALLDRDDMDGFGPETITVKNLNQNGQYNYFVHNYSNQNSTASKELSKSKGRVLIFGDNKLLHQVEIGKDLEGKYWNVFKVNNGNIEVLNIVSDTQPTN